MRIWAGLISNPICEYLRVTGSERGWMLAENVYYTEDWASTQGMESSHCATAFREHLGKVAVTMQRPHKTLLGGSLGTLLGLLWDPLMLPKWLKWLQTWS